MAATPPCAVERDGWSLERALFALAGTVTLISAVLTVAVSPWFALLTAFVGFNQWLFVAFGACPASLLLSRLPGVASRPINITGGAR